ncbi:MAG: hypothetical protein KatS3mg086_025 [Candidatus Dojkabacteria bacterium]|nr:MAG: hypothetical protein KatS3mg086_025 [Candidatus Dojkabacteria bacterium]
MSNPDTFKSSITSIPLSKERKSEDFYNFLKFLRENNYDIDYIDLNFLARLFFFFKHLGISAYHQIYEEIQTLLNYNFIKFLIFLENNNFNFNSEEAFDVIRDFIENPNSKSQQLHEQYFIFLENLENLENTQDIQLDTRRKYITHDKGLFRIVDYFREKFNIDFSAENHNLIKLLIFLFKYNTSNRVENYAQNLIKNRINTLKLLLLSHLPEDSLNDDILRHILTSEKITPYIINLLKNNWDQIITSFPQNKQTSLIIILNWLIELLNTEPQITPEIMSFYKQTLQPERIVINKIVLKYNSVLKQAISEFKYPYTYDSFLRLLNKIQEIDQIIKSILKNNEFYNPDELYALVMYEIYNFQANIVGFLYKFFDSEITAETNSLFINLFFEYIFLNLDIATLSNLLKGNVVVSRKFLSFVESEPLRGVLKDDLSQRLTICFKHIFRQSPNTGIQLKILERCFMCYKNRKINKDDYVDWLKFVKENCDTNSLIRFANMMYLSNQTSTMYLPENYDDFINHINYIFLKDMRRPAFGES